MSRKTLGIALKKIRKEEKLRWFWNKFLQANLTEVLDLRNDYSSLFHSDFITACKWVCFFYFVEISFKIVHQKIRFQVFRFDTWISQFFGWWHNESSTLRLHRSQNSSIFIYLQWNWKKNSLQIYSYSGNFEVPFFCDENFHWEKFTASF